MREILFRGKRLDNGEWIEGAFCSKDYDMPFGPMVDKPSIVKLDDPCSGFWFEVDPDTVCQFTSLLDKNGKRIFEGDVVIYDNSPYNAYCTPQKGEITWRNGSLCFEYRPWNSAMYRSLCSDDFFAAKCEVIGNIHDNPELMGGGGADA